MERREHASASRSALFPRCAFDLVVIAASAGGIAALKPLLARLPMSFGVPIAIVQHLSAVTCTSMLLEVLGWRALLHTKFARSGDRLRAGTVFIAPPDRHLIIGSNCRLELEESPKVNFVRPAADRLFETAAAQFGPRLLGVVLTGYGQDGAAGAARVKELGGAVIVQDPVSADADAMPRAALAATAADLVLPLESIASAITSFCEVRGTRELFCGSQRVMLPTPA